MNTSAAHNPYPKPGQELDDHEIAQIFPMMDKDDRKALDASIKSHGLREPIILLDGKILDGRNRWEACRAVGAEPRFEFYNYKTHGQSPTAYVMDRNFTRRHLTVGQKAAIAVEALPFFKAEAAARQKKSGQDHQSNIHPNLQRDELDQRPEVAAEDIPQAKPAPKKSAPTPPAGRAANTPAPSKATAPKAAPTKAASTPSKSAGTGGAKPKAKATPSAPPVPAPIGTATAAAAQMAGVSESAVKMAAKLSPGALAEVKAGHLSLNAAATKKGAKEKRDLAHQDALQRIKLVAGESLAKAAREGLRLKGRKEVAAYAALTDDEMLKIRGLIEDGWKVDKAIKQKIKTLSKTNSIGELLTRAAQNNGMYTLLVGDWEILVTRKK